MVRAAPSLTLIDRARARSYLECFDLIDPAGRDDVAAVVARCLCFTVSTQPIPSVVAVRITDTDTLWIDAAAGRDHQTIFRALDLVARQSGLSRLGFQTARRGLVRLAQRMGYHLAEAFGPGWTLYKATP